ncbi:MAG: CAP domain-containing protein [Minisyncoccales bacterium]
MKKNILLIFCGLILIIFSGLFLTWGWPFKWSLPEPELNKTLLLTKNLKESLEKQIFSPPPLRLIKQESEQVVLTKEEIIKLTNFERIKLGLPSYQENQILNKMAQAKVEDMFKYQYFTHESPTGEGIEDLANQFGYKFLKIGENLAMGDFQSEEELVKSWLNSPGHRENILNTAYQEIGVAVQKGILNGETVWLAVQHFGLPLSVCQQPNETLKEKIENNEIKLQEFEGLLIQLKSELEQIKFAWSPVYREKIEEYNQLVDQYNNLLLETKKLINQYNYQVELFNNCLASFNN